VACRVSWPPWDHELPDLRFLLMCGKGRTPGAESGRWLRPGRRFLNVWGPTEATVTTTLDRVAARKSRSTIG